MAIIEEIVEEDETSKTIDAMKAEGNALFGQGEYERAADKYTEALTLCPDEAQLPRALLLSNLAAANIKLQKWEAAVEAATKAIEAEMPNEKALERRAFAYAQISDKLEKAIEDYQALKEKCPERTREFERKIADLNAKIEKRNEDMKKDMMEKLKSLGNLCLRPFGMSTDDFALTPNGQGGYSIQMKGRGGAANDATSATEEEDEKESPNDEEDTKTAS